MDESPPHADALNPNSLDPESADRTLEKRLKTAYFCWRRQSVVGSHSQKVAENRYAPVREVCIQITGPMRSIAALRPRLKNRFSDV